MSVRHQRTEAQINHACDRVVEGFGGRVVRFMPGRIDGQQTPGVPRRRYYIDSHALWWSPRSEKGRLTAMQRAFLLAEYSAGQLVGAGDDRALHQVVYALQKQRRDDARELAWSYAVAIAGRDVGR